MWDKIPQKELPPQCEIYIQFSGIERVFAKINDRGLIELQDGSTFSTPSGAARAINGGKNINGWIRWKRTSDSKSLAELRKSEN